MGRFRSMEQKRVLDVEIESSVKKEDLLEFVHYDGAGSLTEGRCRQCNWSWFAKSERELEEVYGYHFEEVHNADDPIERFMRTLGSPSTSSWPKNNAN